MGLNQAAFAQRGGGPPEGASGGPPEDAGPPPDSGAPPDAGPPEEDTSAPEEDTSAPEEDTSAPEEDTSAPEEDNTRQQTASPQGQGRPVPSPSEDRPTPQCDSHETFSNGECTPLPRCPVPLIDGECAKLVQQPVEEVCPVPLIDDVCAEPGPTPTLRCPGGFPQFNEVTQLCEKVRRGVVVDTHEKTLQCLVGEDFVDAVGGKCPVTPVEEICPVPLIDGECAKLVQQPVEEVCPVPLIDGVCAKLVEEPVDLVQDPSRRPGAGRGNV